jgi:hypothetical protein
MVCPIKLLLMMERLLRFAGREIVVTPTREVLLLVVGLGEGLEDVGANVNSDVVVGGPSLAVTGGPCTTVLEMQRTCW